MSARDFPLAVRGAGGGGEHTPTEAPDSLRSTQIAEIVDLLGEGEMGGLANGLKSVYLDGVPIENPDGTRNFEGVEFHMLLGAPGQQPVDGFSQVQQEIAVGVKVTHATPVTRTIVDTDVDTVRVSVNFPSLSLTQTDGDVVGTSVEWTIEIQSNGGGFIEKYHDTVTGKAINGFKKSVLLNLRDAGPPPWGIRLKRVTADAVSAFLQDQIWWDSYTEIESLKMAYTHSAAAFLRVDAKTFSRIPTRGYDLVGTADWLIPTNYDPYARTYTGTWNGTFKAGWTNNPAWVYYNLVLSKRYGLGNYIASADKWAMYQLGQWCDGQLDDGRGGVEPRYQINCQIMQQVEALQLLQDIAAVFRGVVLYGAGQIGAAWDAPGDPVAQYTPANVVDGLFHYSDGSEKLKKSVCTCWWNDPTQLGKRVPVTWQDDDLVAKYGVREMSISPIGVDRPSQALRHAKWALYSQEMEDQVVGFRVGSDGVAGRLGQVFQITDPSETGERLGGRIHSATATSVVLDGPVELLPGETYTLCVTQPDPADPTALIVEEKPVTTGPGTTSTLAVFPAFSAAPAAETTWILSANTALPTLWRYLSIEEVRAEDGGDAAGSDGHTKVEYEITAVAHDPGKWDLVEHGLKVGERPVRRLADGASAPIDLVLTEVVSQDGQKFKSQIVVGWSPTSPGQSYRVSWRLNSGTWQNEPPTRAWSLDIELPALGLVDVQVFATSVKGDTSLPLEGSITAIGNQHAAADVVGLNLVNTSKGVVVTFNRPTDFDWTTTELRLDGANPDLGTYLADVAATTYNLGWPSVGTHVVWARNKRRGGPNGAWAFAGITYTGPDLLIDQLDGRLSEEQFETALQDRLDLIDGDGPGSVNERVAQFSQVGVNLVMGSGFDIDTNADGVADGWHTFTGGTGDAGRVLAKSLVDALNGGGKAQRVSISTATNTQDSGVSTDAPQPVIEAGLTYTLSGWLRTAATGVKLWARCLNGTGGIIQDFVTPESPTDQLAHRMAVTFTAPAGSAACSLYARGINAAGEWLEVDAVQLQTGTMAGPYMPNPGDVAALQASVNTEIQARVDGDTALATSLSAVSAQVAANSAAITDESTARADADSAQATQISGISAQLNAKGTNMLQNSSFELDSDGDGLASNWVAYTLGAVGTVSSSTQPGRVSGQAQRRHASNLGTTANDRVGVRQFITVTTGAMAQATPSVYVKGTAGATGRLYCEARAGGVLRNSMSQTVALGASWARLSGTLTVQADVDEIRVYVWAQAKTGGGAVDIDIDDAMLEPGNVLNAYSPGVGEAGSAYAAVIEERDARVSETGELSAQWSVKVDANGRWAGIITRAGGDESTIDLLADVVRIGSTAFADQAMFAVYTVPTVVNGITLPAGIYVRDLYFGTLNGSRIVADTITTRALQVGAVTAAANDDSDFFTRTWPAADAGWVPDDTTSAGTSGVLHTYGGGTLSIRSDMTMSGAIAASGAVACLFQVELWRKPSAGSATHTMLRRASQTVPVHAWASLKRASASVALNFQLDPGDLTEGQSYWFGIYIVAARVWDSSGNEIVAGSGSSLITSSCLATMENKV